MTLKVLQGERPNLRVAVTEKGTAQHADYESIEIGETIKFKVKDLDRYRNRNWDARVYDFLVLAAACEFCDRTLRRSQWGWARRFELKVPVHDLAVWESPEAHSSLLSALKFLTGDEWDVSFYKRHEDADEINPQSRLELLDGSKTIIPFSNGMDSRAVGAMLDNDQHELIRLRVGANAADRPKVGQRKVPFMTVPYEVKPSALRFNESSARTRGFKFALLSGIAAYLVGTNDVAMPESGQGALGPSLVQTSHGYEDYRSHPLFLGRMQRLISAVFNHTVTYRLPRLWNTKGETLRDFAAMPQHKDEWSKTWSCWQQNRQVSVDHKRRHCGVCAACMLRRLSVHAAGLEESSDTYVWENLGASTFEAGAATGFNKKTKAMKQYAIAGALHLDHLAELYSSPLHQQRLDRYSWFLSEELGMTHQDARERLNDLLQQHDIEWNAFLKDLDPNSFVSNWLAA
jgi:7-cyano-7-deazaguanine synthase in queuosine biosynthesis